MPPSNGRSSETSDRAAVHTPTHAALNVLGAYLTDRARWAPSKGIHTSYRASPRNRARGSPRLDPAGGRSARPTDTRILPVRSRGPTRADGADLRNPLLRAPLANGIRRVPLDPDLLLGACFLWRRNRTGEFFTASLLLHSSSIGRRIWRTRTRTSGRFSAGPFLASRKAQCPGTPAGPGLKRKI